MLNLAEEGFRGPGDGVVNLSKNNKSQEDVRQDCDSSQQPQQCTNSSGVPVTDCHWSSCICEAVVSLESDESLSVLGGSDNGQFPYLGEVLAGVQQGELKEGAIILEIQGQKIAGYTQRDVVAWLSHCTRDGNPCVIRTVPAGSVTRDLRQYLHTRFPKGGADHDLQSTIRDNLYLRTVPVTTRKPRPGEQNGLDYTFLSHQEFEALHRSGNLLESGVFQGNHYGTPKPPSQPPTVGDGRKNFASSNGGPGILPGAHPSSEGKRRRNRSNVEAMAANMTEPMPPVSYNPPPNHPNQNSSGQMASRMDHHSNRGGGDDDGLGPLPPNWEQAFTEKGEPYFIDHIASTSSWLDPRLAKVQKQNAEECTEDELPYGWERIDDPQYGTYYIDHVNRLTQYENPVTMAKTQADNSSSHVQNNSNGPITVDQPMPSNNSTNNTFPRPKKSPSGGFSPKDENSSVVGRSNEPPAVAPKRNSSHWNNPNNTTTDSHPHQPTISSPLFTRNPAELRGQFLRTQLIKSSRGLGFTIVGGDDTKEEFLQIKSVVPNGPAWQDGNLRTGDVLVYVNDTCVLGYTHADVVNIFQNIEPGRSVYLEVCRGYPLPFDPNDPNTEIVTTVAVNSIDSRSTKSMFGESYERSRHNSSESLNTAKSMPDLSNPDRVQQVPRPGSADLLSSENFEPTPDILDFYSPNASNHEYLTIPIVKGSMGFGFTIADSVYGQKVKKILDRSRCKNLMEGDILVDINSINVKRMTHTEVVQVLKECAQGQEAIVMVERGGLTSSAKGRLRKEPLPSPKKSSMGPSSASPAFTANQYRSKTPTADMYSSQTKEIMPNRPKTPLVDTRNRSKTPNVGNDCYHHGIESIDHRIQPNSNHYPPNTFSKAAHVPSHQLTSQDVHYDPKMNTITQQMSHTAIDTSNYGYYGNDSSRGSGNEFVNYPSNVNVPLSTQNSYNYQNNTSFPPDQNYQPQNSSGSYEYDVKRNFNYTQYQDHQPFTTYYPNSNGNSTQIPSNPSSINNNGHNTSIENIVTPGYGYMYPKDGFENIRQDSGYSSQTQIPSVQFPYPQFYGQNNISTDGFQQSRVSNPPPSYTYRDNSLRRRKVSTSFEHEHPAPVSMPRYPDGRHPIGSRVQGMPPNGNIRKGHEFTVTLARQETGFGFRIVGGTEEGSQVSIGHIVSGGAADQDGTVLTGDEILAVNGENVIGGSHHKVVTLMAEAASRGIVTLLLCRRNHQDVHNRSMEISFPYDITVTRREDEGFGFVIISSVTKTGSTIGRIIAGSPAERCGRLHVGDKILSVNGEDIKNMDHSCIVNLIKLSGYSVTLTIGPPGDDSSSSTNSQKADSDIGEEMGEYHTVELQRGARGFGFSIRGGRDLHNMPLFVLRIAEGGPADHISKLKVADQLIEINGHSTKGMTHADAIEMIKHSNNSVSLVIKRGGKIPQAILDGINSGGGSVVSPVGPPLPNTNIRSAATLPPSSPNQSPAYNSQHMPNYSYPSQGQPQMYPHNGGVRPPMVPLHSSPAMSHQYPSPLSPNGPLGQSSPRVVSNENYWNSRIQ